MYERAKLCLFDSQNNISIASDREIIDKHTFVALDLHCEFVFQTCAKGRQAPVPEDIGLSMEHDEKIISYIARDEKISQRQLAKLSELSLGQLNLILHRLVEKGFVTIEKLNARSMRYILTPKGIARNAGRTYNYIKNAFKLVLLLKAEVEHIYGQYEANGYIIYLDGESDEIAQILHQIANERKLPGSVWLSGTSVPQDTDKKPVVLLWQAKKEEIYKKQGIEYINLLNGIDCT